VVAGDRVAAPDATVNVTPTPDNAFVVDETLTTRGVESVCPTSPTCPFPETIANADGVFDPVPVGSEFPPHATAAETASKESPTRTWEESIGTTSMNGSEAIATSSRRSSFGFAFRLDELLHTQS
jgi:hypothetical protein